MFSDELPVFLLLFTTKASELYFQLELKSFVHRSLQLSAAVEVYIIISMRIEERPIPSTRTSHDH